MHNEQIPAGAGDPGPFYHGTKADLAPGDLLGPGYSSNYGGRAKANFVYLTATLDAARWGAELGVGKGPGRIYRVEPTGPFEDDPNLTDQRFPGNPTRSYRTRNRCASLMRSWGGSRILPNCCRTCSPIWKNSKRQGVEAINE